MHRHATNAAEWTSTGLLHRATMAMARLGRTWRVRRLKRETIQSLGQLSDRALHDIGIDRSEIESVAGRVAQRNVAVVVGPLPRQSTRPRDDMADRH